MTVETISALDPQIAFGTDAYMADVANIAEGIPNIKPGTVPMFGFFSQALALSGLSAEPTQFLPLFNEAIKYQELKGKPVSFESILHVSEYIIHPSNNGVQLTEALEKLRGSFNDMKLSIHDAQSAIAMTGTKTSMQSDFYPLRFDTPKAK